jgi:hypothetical protein
VASVMVTKRQACKCGCFCLCTGNSLRLQHVGEVSCASMNSHGPIRWYLTASLLVPCTSQVGMLDGALSHLAMGAGSKRDFVAGLARGLGANMGPNTRGDFLNDLAR